jgi:anaerobic ribonucleoside-triphosphate reductase activating protein
VKETTWIIDEATGALTIEGLSERELREVASDLLPAPAHVNCARPVNAPPANDQHTMLEQGEPTLRVFRIYHNSVVEGPGRRSVAQLAGCTLLCPGCHSVETHPTDGGVVMSIGEIIELLLAREGEPRDGVTILGGEPFLQHEKLPLLLRELKARRLHTTLYSGYTLEELRARLEPTVHESLALADILIDGRFVAAEAKGAGEWRGSRNQRIINLGEMRRRAAER